MLLQPSQNLKYRRFPYRAYGLLTIWRLIAAGALHELLANLETG